MLAMRGPRGGRPRLAAAGATVVAALVVGGCGSASTHTVTVGGGGAAVSTHSITLPSTLDGFQDLTAAAKARGARPSVVSKQRADQVRVETATVAAYRQAYGGAAVAYRAYANPGLTLLPYVIAVRASSPGMVLGPVPDAAYLGLAKPPRQVVDSGPVQCEVDWEPPTAAGHPAPPSSELVAACQRTGGGVTVFTGEGGGFKGPSGLSRAVALTNAAFSAVGG
jgi:hypothetical protein